MTDIYDLYFYPPGAGFEGRDWRGTFTTVQEAASASPFPDLTDWDTAGGTRWDTSSQRITASERDYQPYSIDHRSTQDAPGSDIQLTLVRGGEHTVLVDPAAYAAAKQAGTTAEFLAAAIADTPVRLTVVEPTGGLVELPTGGEQ